MYYVGAGLGIEQQRRRNQNERMLLPTCPLKRPGWERQFAGVETWRGSTAEKGQENITVIFVLPANVSFCSKYMVQQDEAIQARRQVWISKKM